MTTCPLRPASPRTPSWPSRRLLVDSVHGCASGLELSAADFAEDVAVAAELDVSDVVPVLADGAFHDSSAS